MSNSINGLGKPVAPPPSRPSGSPDNSGAMARPAAGGGDSVNLTDTARQLQQLMVATPAAETVDANRVDSVRQALNDGQYAIDSRQIAERLLQFDS